jgi:5,10-methylenetetrahydromethanopterin reductase
MIFDVALIPDQSTLNTVEAARVLDSSGNDACWITDSPPLGWGDVYVAMALCAQATTRLKLRTGVTNPVSREAMVTANAFVTLNQLSKGRAEIGIGTGDSAVRAQGGKPAKFAAVIEYIDHMRRIFAERGTKVPIYLAASGPKALAHAGRVADGALVSVGCHPSVIKRALDHIEAGAREAGRRIEDIDVAFLAGLAIADSWEEAKREASPLAARRAKDAHYHPDFFFPPDLEHLRSQAETIARNYNYQEHLSADAAHIKFVTDRIVDAYTLAGTADDCERKITVMGNAGVRHIVLFPTGHDRLGTISRFIQSVLPRFKQPPTLP